MEVDRFPKRSQGSDQIERTLAIWSESHYIIRNKNFEIHGYLAQS
jgi:hypothetical protein